MSILLQVEDDRQPHPQEARYQAGGEGLGRQTPHRLERGLVEQRMRGRARDRDRADRAVRLDEDLQLNGALESLSARGRTLILKPSGLMVRVSFRCI